MENTFRDTRQEPHYRRLSAGAKHLGLINQLPEFYEFEAICETLIHKTQLTEGRVYFQMTGGEAPRQWVVNPQPPVNMFAYTSDFKFPNAAKAEAGTRAITAQDARGAFAEVKTNMLLYGVQFAKQAQAAGATEVILFNNNDHLIEGSSSSVWIVENGQMIKPESDHKALPGTTSQLIAEAARNENLNVSESPIDRKRLFAADEVMLASTSRLALGVYQIDDQPIGNGHRAGPVSQRIASQLRKKYGLEPKS